MRVQFDQEIMEELSAAIQGVFQKHPQVLRSVGLFLDYQEPLNDSSLANGLWLSAAGEVTTTSGIVGSAVSCLRLLNIICGRAGQLVDFLGKEVQKVSTELLQMELRREQVHQRESRSSPPGEQPQGTAGEAPQTPGDSPERSETV